MTEPSFDIKISGDWDEYLSADCSVLYLKRQGGAAMELLSGVFNAVEAIFSRGGEPDTFGNLRLKDMLKAVRQSEETITRLDAALRQIPNVR